MPFDPSKYPANWKAFSKHIRFERAKGKCEQCGAVNYERGKKGSDGIWRSENDIHGLNSDVGFALYGDWDFKCSKVILTVAHLDNEGGVCRCKADTGMKCVDPNHVLALCQACHLALDLPHHIENARQTRIKKNDAARPLFTEENNA
ncbi:hypothetical protein [Geitlerinema calcuttense]|uniref:HNH endonuclease n=1 Tax=Geitlerinema calcuttense NRMC-F 0142 TaxID=2922238 RepID=A0ABT7LV80_9CYAN|nr:hypothetical protein [Geitlerinema calcuttense]MDL5055933.1 hypothetical protein [Geitlerinema calcuttense NRMC-F 0142]